MENDRLFVGLGNPGSQYSHTRHNIGFMVVEELVRDQGWSFREDKKFLGYSAKGEVGESRVYLLEPTTFMNESGRAVRKMADYYKIPPEHVLVVTDDIALPFGEIRLKPQGGPGGHNGLKSIQSHLGSQAYPRMRMGVGDREQGTLSGHVLGRFSAKEQEGLDSFLRSGTELLKRWMAGERLQLLMNGINRKTKAKPKTPPQEEAGEQNNEQRYTPPL